MPAPSQFSYCGFVPSVLAPFLAASAKGGDVRRTISISIPGEMRLESVGPRLPWTCPEWTSDNRGVVHSIKEFSDENYVRVNSNCIGDVGLRNDQYRPTSRDAKTCHR